MGGFPPPGRDVFGGIVTSCKALLSSSLVERFDVLVIDTTQLSNPPPSGLVRLALAARRLIEYVRALRRSRPDCVLIFSSSGASMVDKGLMARAAGWLGVPVLMFPRGGRLLERYDSSGTMRMIARFALATPAKVLCQGQEWHDFVTRRLGRAAADAPIVPNWTATDELLKVGERRTRTENARPLRLLFVGWADREKGLLELLQVYRSLSSSRVLDLEIVGEGNAGAEARGFVEAHVLTSRVTFSGWLRGEQLVDAYRRADVFVLPSWVEGLPNAMIEAMAARLPVVVTAVGNIPSEVSHWETGILVPPRNPRALEAALGTVLDDAEVRERLADAAHRFARERFGAERGAEQLADLIQEVVNAVQESRTQAEHRSSR